MNVSKILFPTDFSPNGKAALRYASSLAAETGATLYILHVDDTTPALLPTGVGYGYVPAVDEIAKQEYDALLSTVPTSENVLYEHKFFRGNAADEILHFAQEEQVDFIVLGTHGRTGLARLLMGSVAEAVLRRAACPVLTVRQPVITPQEAHATYCKAIEE